MFSFFVYQDLGHRFSIDIDISIKGCLFTIFHLIKHIWKVKCARPCVHVCGQGEGEWGEVHLN